MTTAERERPTETPRSSKGLLIGGLVLAFLVAGFLSGFASSAPDGLEKVAEDQGFLEAGEESASSGFFLADYAVRGIEDERLAGGLAGVIGVALTLLVGTLLFLAVSKLRGRRAPRP